MSIDPTPNHRDRPTPLPEIAEHQRTRLLARIALWIADPQAFDNDPASNALFYDVLVDLARYLVLQRYPTATAIDLVVRRGAVQFLGVRGPDGEALDERTDQSSALEISNEEWWELVRKTTSALPLHDARYRSHDAAARARGDLPLSWPFMLPTS